MNELLESFSYKRKHESVVNCKQKRPKIVSHEKMCAPNIFTFELMKQIGSYNVTWLLCEPDGTTIRHGTENVTTASYKESEICSILDNCAKQKCTVVVHSLELNKNKYDAVGLYIFDNNMFCVSQNSVSRYGLIRLDGKCKYPNLDEICASLSLNKDCQMDSDLKCEKVVKIFVAGRIQSWW
jgi:hypothetical protein